MKVCPDCGFSNEERFPACVWCNTVLVDVPSTPSADPNSPEHAQRALARSRRRATRRQLAFAACVYAGIITGLAVCPGFIFDPHILVLYLGSSLVVAAAVLLDWAGSFLASMLQGGFSVLLVLHFGPMQPFIVFMLVGHILVPTFFHLWTEMIHDTNR